MPNLVMGDGPVPCTAMAIGEAPGEAEDREGRPFVGPSGQLLNEALEAAGAKRALVYVTNIYKHRPPNNRTPTMEEAEEHFDYLADELSAVQPLGILLLGAFALEATTGLTGITQHRGAWFEHEPAPMLPTFHPAYVLYNRRKPEIRDAFFGDVQEFVNRTLHLAGD